MNRLRLLILPAFLAFAAGMGASIALMNTALGVLLAVFVFAALPAERIRFWNAAKVLLPWAGVILLSYLLNAELPLKNLKFYFAWLSLPLVAAFLPEVSGRQVLGILFGTLGLASLLGFVQHLEGIGLLETGLCNFPQEAFTGQFNQYLCGYKAGTRARGFFYTPMTFGAVVMFGLLSASILLQRKDAPKKFWGAAALLQVIALVATSSRNAWLGFVTMLPLALGKRKKAWAIASAGAILVAAVVVSSPVLRDRLLSFGKVNTDPGSSVGARIFLWKDAWAQFQERPLVGWGPGGFRRNVEQRHAEVNLLSTKHAHNSYMQMLAEGGLIGMLGMGFSLGWMALRSWRSSDETLRRMGLATLGAFAVAGLFEANWLDSEVVMNLFFWQALAWNGLESTTSPPREEGTRRLVETAAV